MATYRNLTDFKDLSSSFNDLNLEYFYFDQFGQLNIRHAIHPFILNIKDKRQKFEEIAEMLPDEVLLFIIDVFTAIKNWVLEFEKSTSYNNAVDKREEVISQFQIFNKEINKAWQQAAPHYLDFYLKNNLSNLGNSQAIESEIKELKEKSLNDASSIEELKKTLQNQSENIEKRLLPILTKGEFLAQEKIFFEEAYKNKSQSFFWMIVAGLLTIAIVIFVICISKICLNFNCFNTNLVSITATPSERTNLFYYYIIKKILANLFILSILIYLLKFSIRNYNASMHNRTVNTHKANAFAASLNLIGNVKDTNKQDEILNLAAKEIFSQQKTGYLSKEGNELSLSVLEKLSGILK